MRRRAWLATTAAAASLPARLSAQSATTLSLGIIPIDAAAEAFYAQDLGLFAKHRLDVTLQMFTSGNAVAAAVAGGALPVGFADVLSVASAHAHGIPFVYLAAGELNTYTDPTLGLLVGGESSIRGPKDLDGKTIAVNALNNITMVPYEAWIDNNGGNSKTIKWIEVPIPAQVQAVVSGRADGTIIGEPFITFGKRQGLRVLFMTSGGIASRFVLSGYITTKAWASKNAGVGDRLAAAIYEAGAWANANRAASAPILAKYTKIPLPVVQQMGRGRYVDAMLASDFQPVIDAAARYGVLSAPFPAKELFSR